MTRQSLAPPRSTLNTKLLKREIVYIEMGIPELIQSSSKSFARLASRAFYSVIKKLVWCPHISYADFLKNWYGVP